MVEQFDDTVLVESASLRERLCVEANTNVLERVGELSLLPNTALATTENVAKFYQVETDTVKKLAQRHQDELQSDGYKVLTKKEITQGLDVPNLGRTPKLGVYPKRAVLRVGMLLTKSQVAKLVRSYLLNVEQSLVTVSGDQKVLTQMANQLTRNATQLSSHATTLNDHALQLSQHAEQLTQNAEQLVHQSRMVSAIVDEIYRNRDSIRGLEKQCQQYEERISSLENQIQIKQVHRDYISSSQSQALREKVKQKGNANTIWKKFNKHFEISRYKHLPKDRFLEAIAWLENY